MAALIVLLGASTLAPIWEEQLGDGNAPVGHQYGSASSLPMQGRSSSVRDGAKTGVMDPKSAGSQPTKCLLGGSHDSGCGELLSSRSSTSASGPVWTNLSTPGGPPPLYDLSMGYDAGDDQTVVFGGFNPAATAVSYTWTFTNGTWTNLSPQLTQFPSARGGMLMTDDPTDGYLLAFGGNGMACSPSEYYGCADTWTFEGDSWSLTNASAPIPAAGRTGFSMAFDSSSSYVLLTDGWATWKWSGANWTPFCASPSNCTLFIPGPDMTGSLSDDPALDGLLWYGAGFTWVFASGNWTNVSATAGQAPSGANGQLVYPPASGVPLLVVTGGYSQNVTLDQFANDSWTVVSSGFSPPARSEAGISYAGSAADILMFGGWNLFGPTRILNETWAWGSSPPISGLNIFVQPTVPEPAQVATFNESFVGGVAPFGYSWGFGDGNTSFVPTPIHSFDAIGHYSVQLWVNDSGGHHAFAQLTVKVYVPLSIRVLPGVPRHSCAGSAGEFLGAGHWWDAAVPLLVVIRGRRDGGRPS